MSDEVQLRITTEASLVAGTEAAAAPAAADAPATVANAQPVEPEEAAGNPDATPTPATEAPVEQ